MKKICCCILYQLAFYNIYAQTKWVNLDSLYQPLPSSVHIYRSTDSVDNKPNVMYYAVADLKDRHLRFTSDTTKSRRLTPSQYFEKNDRPLLVVNTSFFSFATNQNLNVVVKKGKIVSYNEHSIPARGKDTLTYYHSFFGALGISKSRNADVAWVYSDSSKRFLYASQFPVQSIQDSVANPSKSYIDKTTSVVKKYHGKNPGLSSSFKKWKMQTVVGGGPVLVQSGEVKISNNEERKFFGKAVNNLEPRTAIGYTKDHKLIILVCEGRSKTAAGLSLPQLAKVLKDLGCIEALNLDGGGSSCMIINGKETNYPSGKGVQRPVPSVFIIERK